MKMLKAEELLIGDWVKVLNYHWDGRPYTGQVDGITKKHGTYYLQFGSALSAEIDICEPIPITPEILEKNGFYWGYPVDVEDMASNVFGELSVEMPSKSWVWDEGAGVISITFPNESDGGEISCENGHCYLSFVFDNVIFVHELQHALKLCGISKNIEL